MDEASSLTQLLRPAIDKQRYPLSPWPSRTILAELEPSQLRPEPPPPLEAYDAPKVRRRRHE